jgi:hypothetical protein
MIHFRANRGLLSTASGLPLMVLYALIMDHQLFSGAKNVRGITFSALFPNRINHLPS